MPWLYVHDWSEHQTYRKDRGRPPWIKLHRALLTNPKWCALSDAEKGHLVSLWIIAADKDGAVPDDPAMCRRAAGLDADPDLKKFIRLGFLRRQSDAKPTPRRRQGDAPETEVEVDTEAEKERSGGSFEPGGKTSNVAPVDNSAKRSRAKNARKEKTNGELTPRQFDRLCREDPKRVKALCKRLDISMYGKTNAQLYRDVQRKQRDQ